MNELSLTLTSEELSDLTHKVRPSAQMRALTAMGLEFRRRADGSVAVDRGHYERVMGGSSPAPKRPRKPPQINWD